MADYDLRRRSREACMRPAGDNAGPWALQAATLSAELRERGIALHVIEQAPAPTRWTAWQPRVHAAGSLLNPAPARLTTANASVARPSVSPSIASQARRT
jgi:hypothetical protein